LFRPGQVVRKLEYALGSHGKTTKVRLPWGAEIQADPGDTIGKNLLTMGVYDVATSETLWRLTEPGERCLDIGANIGCMTGLLAAKAQSRGMVYSFEPHPVIFGRFQANISGLSRDRFATIEARQMAVGDKDGTMHLVEPEGFTTNQGSAMLTQNAEPNRNSYPITVAQLDSLFPEKERFGVAKVDVEGWELSVFQGAKQILKEHRIRDLVFEDFESFPSKTVKYLQSNGYTIFHVGKRILGPVIWNPLETEAKNVLLPYEPINYLATVDPKRAVKLMSPRGWFCLKAKA